ncbi:MAG: hypothetical protein QXH55_04345 [Candidatus Korarchaeota archaeon]|nr:hypothetical protein [Thermoproteota archaeon]MCR8463458.1 hypothetical protein [Thermoproteota archaeon]MCR8470879.1 hypothetical protein [Thermoproteota archaeon]MCR8472558.1 hypothetical protein [Thermoproteota archaeon]MCR8473551.1 hypothetical protein [Thermoproteota archaeon]
MSAREEELLLALKRDVPRNLIIILLENLNSDSGDVVRCAIKHLLEDIGTRFSDMIGAIKIKFLDKPRLKDLPIYYDRRSSTIFVNSVLLAKDLLLYYSCASVDPIDVLFYVFMHEYGHHQINMMGIKPMDIDSRVYYVIYFKFEDFVISRFLRKGVYRNIESKILSFNALRSLESLSMGIINSLFEWHISYLARSMVTRLMSNIATVALASALGYLNLYSVDVSVPGRIMNIIEVIEFNMRQVSENRIEAIPDLAYRTCYECYKNL